MRRTGVWGVCWIAANAALLFMNAGVTLGEDAPSSATWLRGSGEQIEMRIAGEIIDADGAPARDFEIECELSCFFSMPTTIEPIIDGHRFEAWFPLAGGKTPFSASLRVRSNDGRQVARRTIHCGEMRVAAIEGVRIEMKRTVRPVDVKVVHEGQPVAGATVEAATSSGLQHMGQSNEQGVARLMLCEGEELTQITAWTEDHRIGGYSFFRRKELDRMGTEHAVELSTCRDLTLTVVDDDGRPAPDVEMRVNIGTGPPTYDYLGQNEDNFLTTDADGKAVFPWLPDWETSTLYAKILSGIWAEESQPPIVDGECCITLRRLKPRKRIEGRIICPPEVDPAGFCIELISFQSHRGEGRTDRQRAFTDADGRFQVDVWPDFTYVAHIDDTDWISDIITRIPYDSETGESAPIELDVFHGEEVEVLATRGADKKPYPGVRVGIHRKHLFSYRENGETHRCVAGPSRWVTTDASGRATARVLPGEVTIRIGESNWHVEESIEVVEGEPEQVVLHRDHGELRTITGRLVPMEGVEAGLKDATIEIGAVDGDYEERLTLSAAEDGTFSFESRAGEIGLFAYSQDGSAAGRLVTDQFDAPLEIRMTPTVPYLGRVVDIEGDPMPGYRVQAHIEIETNDEYYSWFHKRRYPVKQLAATADAQGRYTIEGIPTEMPVGIFVWPPGADEGVEREAEVYLELGEDRPPHVIRIGDAPPAQKSSLEERYARSLRDARLSGYDVMVLAYRDTGDTHAFVNEHLVSYDGNDDNAVFMQLVIKSGENAISSEDAEYMKQRGWEMPGEGHVFGCAISAQGDEMGRIVVDVARAGAVEKALAFVSEHAHEPVDLKKKWDEAFAEAERSGRSVWVRLSGRYCGPCFRFSRWLDEQHELLAKDYVILKIDAFRNLHGAEVAERVTLGEHHGIPFHAIFTAAGEYVINSAGPLGNIGCVEGFDGKRHLRRMLMATRKNLTDEEIDAIVGSIED